MIKQSLRTASTIKTTKTISPSSTTAVKIAAKASAVLRRMKWVKEQRL